MTIPLAAIVLTTSWYEFNCQFHSRCDRFGKAELLDQASRLPPYFLHQKPLVGRWSRTEHLHMADVRNIYDIVAAISFLALIICGAALFKYPDILQRSALWNLFIIVALLAILPIFGYFWKHIFHALLFTNEHWKTNRADVSWYLMPRVFFRNSFILIIAVAASINACLYLSLRFRK